MSHKRSFQYMSRDELTVKRFFDDYRLKILEEGALAPLVKHGIGGLDETIYFLRHALTGQRRKKKDYFSQQLDWTDQELASRGPDSLDERLVRDLAVEPNPATLFTMNKWREELKGERIGRMIDESEALYPSERLKHVKSNATDFFGTIADYLGNFGNFIRNSWLWMVGVGAASLVIYCGVQWANNAKIYDQVAQRYIASSEMGADALVLKREIPDVMDLIYINLTYTPEISFEIDDSEITIPEKLSNPQLARGDIILIDGWLLNTIPDFVVMNYNISEQDKVEIILNRDEADQQLTIAAVSLSGAFDQGFTYGYEMGLVSGAKQDLREAVAVMENHMPGQVVSAENDAHAIKTIWKWSTIISALVSGLGFYNAYKNSDNLGKRRKYYKY